MAWAAAHMEETNRPSTPNGVKKVCKFRVNRKGTGSLNSTMPFISYAATRCPRRGRELSIFTQNTVQKQVCMLPIAPPNCTGMEVILKHFSCVLGK